MKMGKEVCPLTSDLRLPSSDLRQGYGLAG